MFYNLLVFIICIGNLILQLLFIVSCNPGVYKRLDVHVQCRVCVLLLLSMAALAEAGNGSLNQGYVYSELSR